MHYLLRTQFSLAAAPALRGHHTLQGNCRSRKTVCDSSGCRRKRDSVPVGTSPGRTGFKTKRRLLCARRRSVGSGPQCHWGHTHKSVCVPGPPAATAARPGNLSTSLDLCGPTELEAVGWGPAVCVLTGPPSWASAHLRSAALQGSLPASRKTAGFSKAASHRVRQPSVPYSVAMEQSLHHNHSRPPPPTIVERPGVSFPPVAPQRLSTPMTREDCLGSFEKDRSVQALYRLWTQGPGHRAMVFSRSSSGDFKVQSGLRPAAGASGSSATPSLTAPQLRPSSAICNYKIKYPHCREKR